MSEEKRSFVQKGEKKSTVLVAEGKKESAILDAEAEKQAAILRAEAKKEATIREAEGQAEAILKIQQANADGLRMIKDAAPDQGVIQLKSLEAFAKAADGKATKIIIPSEIQGIAGLAKICDRNSSGEQIEHRIDQIENRGLSRKWQPVYSLQQEALSDKEERNHELKRTQFLKTDGLHTGRDSLPD